ncbi:GIY-YIG nuclease family protein [Rhodococcus sp. AH-ZY2]|uniref:GIY-YIG nuclease family protein n=1 Tax=Rhodococcus sp. AH-ZY2 TaxID=3047468 RepID=UPI0035A94FB7
MDTTGCVERDGLTLLYVGISPKAPPKNGRLASSQTLRSRISTHYSGNAEGSTLRLSLGCLLAPTLGIELRRFGSGTRMHFGEGERELSRWMHHHARVAWIVDHRPWELEERLFGKLVLPLNISGNANCAFSARMSGLRYLARANARELPVLPNPGVGGRYP